MPKALITGGSRGIGLAICRKFADEGYEVISPARGELDLADNKSIDAYIFQNSGTVFDVLVNNAGINPVGGIEDIRDNDFDETIQVNLRAPFRIIRGFVGAMKRQGFGRIVNIGSIWGVVSKEKRMTYSASKWGLNGITRALAVELARHNILVNSVCPGYVNTELTAKNVSAAEAARIKEGIPLGRFAEAHEIAEAVYFLASEKNTYITGQFLIVDGGYTAI